MVGDQSGSNFTITDCVEVTGAPIYTVKVRITFNCKLYDVSGSITKTITDGVYVGTFQNI